MRKQLLAMLLMFIGSLTYAQIQKGDVLVGGSLRLSTFEFNDNRNNNFSISPRLGFLVSDRTSIGPVLGFEHIRSKQEAPGVSVNDRTNVFSFGAYMRNYRAITEKLYFFLESSVVYGTGNRNFEFQGSSDKGDVSILEIRVAPRLSYFISDNMAVDISLLNATFRDESTEDPTNNGANDDTSRFFLSGGLNSVGFGLSWFLR